MKLKLVTAVLALALVTLAACGGDDSGTVASGSNGPTVKVEMRDISYSITTLDVKKGDTVTFEFTNKGKVAHDAFVGDEMAQEEHEKEMSSSSSSTMSEMDHGADSDALTVKPGDSDSLTYTFDEAGTVLIGCHQTGHYAAGMKITVNVS